MPISASLSGNDDNGSDYFERYKKSSGFNLLEAEITREKKNLANLLTLVGMAILDIGGFGSNGKGIVENWGHISPLDTYGSICIIIPWQDLRE